MAKDPLSEFESVMEKIEDGDVFERFAQDLLCQVLGEIFTPIGGTHDRAIDGLDRTFLPSRAAKTIYQVSIEKDPRSKIRKTLKALRDNQIECARLFYVTNQKVDEQDVLAESMFEEFAVAVACRDRTWLRGHVNSNEGTLRTYLTFLETHYHQFATPGSSPIIANLEGDPRLYVFFRQQWENASADARLDEVLTDTLILFALEGTDPDKGILLNRQEIVDRIRQTAGLSVVVEKLIDGRLKQLSTQRPRRIRYYRDTEKYCLPYETRIEIQHKNLSDAALESAFRTGGEERIRKLLADDGLRVSDVRELLDGVINKLFKQQGLEFSSFVTKSEIPTSVETSLDEIIAQTVDTSSVVPKNRARVKSALLAAMRQLIYEGSPEEQEYLRRLSNSYMLLFMLQCDPKLATYFSALAGKLRVFVDNSILVPAISERPLDRRHRRYWTLLERANKAGVRLKVDKSTITELASHIRKTIETYSQVYAGREDLFSDEEAIAYVDEILIRSFFYSRMRGNQLPFEKYIDQFVTPKSARMEEELIEWLAGTFGIETVDITSLPIDQNDCKRLTDELADHKASRHQAQKDARMILAVYGLRERDGERSNGGIFGYRSWWLSNDTTTQRAVEACFGKKYRTSCHMRPDFLYNYISLAPNYAEANEVFDIMFPSLLGVNISHHIPNEVRRAVQTALREHENYDAARVRAKLRTLADQLISGERIVGSQLKADLDSIFSTPRKPTK